ILGRTGEAARYAGRAALIVGIGDNAVRERIAGQLAGIARFYTAVHPSAVVAQGVVLGEGTAVMALAAVNVGSHIGRHCILNTSCSVDHDCQVGDFTHVSPGAHLAGGVRVGPRCHLGVGCAVIPGITLCAGCVVGAGGVVVRDLAQPGTYAGVPVRRLEGGA
ncbi:MAG TPA: NeuD/PglB/VioB family sugar acetyltransferase, partial [Candidatus Limnocylindria bacterium]|nr:NeuD/PglB/VioB family sugar acetyltransferase [Candidatus Limnocylindria bacterium]